MKKIIAIMLALAFVLAFSACKKADDDNSGADETSTVSSAEATSIEADSKTQEYIDNFTNSTIENPAESIEIAGQNVSASAGQSVTVPVTVTENSRISRADFARYMMATGNMATDVGTVLYGAEAVESGLMDQLGSLSDALAYLHAQIAQKKKKRSGPDAGGDN